MNRASKRKQQVLEVLYNNKSDYISGQKLSDKLGVSRTTIWKYIQSLREQGYLIESSSKIGYRLVKAPDILSPEEIKKDLKTKILGKEIIYHEQVDSTNKLAEATAQKGAKEGTIIIAREQVGGKGRLGRKYFCPPGGIWFSVILRPDLKPNTASQLNLVAAVALAKTINQLTELEPKIKWPNDILINNKKVSGILTEINAEIDQINYLILGLGLNLNIAKVDFPEDLYQKATSIQAEQEKEVSKLNFFTCLLEELENEYLLFQEKGFSEVVKKWQKYNMTLGRTVTVNNRREVFTGEAVDIDSDGNLLVKLSDGVIKKVVSGDVTLETNYDDKNQNGGETV